MRLEPDVENEYPFPVPEEGHRLYTGVLGSGALCRLQVNSDLDARRGRSVSSWVLN